MIKKNGGLGVSLEERILEICYEEGCSLAGIAPAEPFLPERKYLSIRLKEGPGLTFGGETVVARTQPSRLLTGVKSILALSFSYRMPPLPPKPGDQPRGSWARFARPRDYHQVISSIMARICSRIQDARPETRWKSCVDTSPLLERAAAHRAGLGFFGKNSCLIHPELGSYTFLGEILLDLSLPPGPVKDYREGCGDCGKCLKACPTGALSAPYCLDYSLCLSHLSQASDYIPPDIRPFMSERLYGCDICQEVCPYNRETDSRQIPGEFLPLMDPYPPLIPLLDLSKKDFAAMYRNSPLFWRGRKILQRNAIIALGNLKAREAEVPLGRLLLEDPRPQIRGYSAWALGKIGSSRALQYLAGAMEKDRDPFVLQEVTGALYGYQMSKP